MKTGLSYIVVCPKGRLPDLSRDEAMEDRPNAQDRKISTVFARGSFVEPENWLARAISPTSGGWLSPWAQCTDDGACERSRRRVGTIAPGSRWASF